MKVRSFSQLRNEFSDIDTFYLGPGHLGSPVRRSRSRGALVAPVTMVENHGNGEVKRRTRSKSRPRALYADTEMVRATGGKCNESKQEFAINTNLQFLLTI